MKESQPLEQKKDEPLDKILNEIKAEFAGDESVEFSIEKLENGAGSLWIRFKVRDSDFSVDSYLTNNIIKKIAKILLNNQYEYRYRGGGNILMELWIDPKFLDGKINWRRWVPRGRSTEFSETEIALLDDIAGYTQLSDKIEKWNHDDYGKFNSFLRLSPLTEAEKKGFEYSVSSVFR